MITELKFARDFTAFWRQTTPMMEGFVRGLNHGAYSRDFRPMAAETLPIRRAFVNEVAFATFCNAVEARKSGRPYELVDEISVAEEVVRARGAWGDGNGSDQLTGGEREDAQQQVVRLWSRLDVANKVSLLHCRPAFFGCGMVDACEGDVLLDDALYEIKAGDRQIRSIDFRQILVYLALNYARLSFTIYRAGLINPRIGISFEMSTDALAQAVSGRDSASLLHAIVYGMSSGDVSR